MRSQIRQSQEKKTENQWSPDEKYQKAGKQNMEKIMSLF